MLQHLKNNWLIAALNSWIHNARILYSYYKQTGTGFDALS